MCSGGSHLVRVCADHARSSSVFLRKWSLAFYPKVPPEERDRDGDDAPPGKVAAIVKEFSDKPEDERGEYQECRTVHALRTSFGWPAGVATWNGSPGFRTGG